MRADTTERALSKEFLKSVTPLERISSTPPQYLVEQEGRTFILERRGQCEYERCQAICCRMICLNFEWNEYLAGFAEKGAFVPFIYRTCRYLEGNFKCRRWNEFHFPRPCDNFPVPGDPMYLEVMETCAFSFVYIGEIKEDGPLDRWLER